MDLNLDSSLRGISGNMESLDSLLQSKAVGDKWFKIDKPSSDESNCFRILHAGVYTLAEAFLAAMLDKE